MSVRHRNPAAMPCAGQQPCDKRTVAGTKRPKRGTNGGSVRTGSAAPRVRARRDTAEEIAHHDLDRAEAITQAFSDDRGKRRSASDKHHVRRGTPLCPNIASKFSDPVKQRLRCPLEIKPARRKCEVSLQPAEVRARFGFSGEFDLRVLRSTVESEAAAHLMQAQQTGNARR